MSGRDAWTQNRHLRDRFRAEVFARAGGHCEIRGPTCKHRAGCGGCAEQVDHIVPRAQGGPLYDPSNLRAACSRCNQARAARATNLKRRSATDPCAQHRFTPASLGVNERCGICGTVGPSREW